MAPNAIYRSISWLPITVIEAAFDDPPTVSSDSEPNPVGPQPCLPIHLSVIIIDIVPELDAFQSSELIVGPVGGQTFIE